MHSVYAVMTCYNRKDMTTKCIASLVNGNPAVDFHFVVADDASNDGTADALESMPYDITVLKGDGSLFWNGGMHLGLQYLLDKFRGDAKRVDSYVLLINDDVVFYDNAVSSLISQCENRFDGDTKGVVVGTIEDSTGNLSFGGVRFTSKHFVKFDKVPPNDNDICDTFNGNCVLIPFEIFIKAGNIDPFYSHMFGDFDYGLQMKRMGIAIRHSNEYIGMCDENSEEGTWHDTSLSRLKRMHLKETPKGLPYKDWFYFVKKNFGLLPAIYHFCTPYVRILIRK